MSATIGISDTTGKLLRAREYRADFDYSGTLDTQDVFDFLNARFNGC